jgi:hypothetical protein
MLRMTQNLKRPGVFRALGEIVILVLGILIAFALDSWWDDQKANRWERVQLQALSAEFSTNLAHVDSVILAHENTASDVRQLLDFATQNPAGATAEFPDSVVTKLIAWRTSELTMGALDALLASGDLGEIRSPLLRRQLTAWKALVLDAQEKESLARDFIEYVLTPTMVGQGLLGPAWAARPPWGQAMPARMVTVTASAELKDMAAARLGHVKLSAYSQRLVREQIEAIMVLIDQELTD